MTPMEHGPKVEQVEDGTWRVVASSGAVLADGMSNAEAWRFVDRARCEAETPRQARGRDLVCERRDGHGAGDRECGGLRPVFSSLRDGSTVTVYFATSQGCAVDDKAARLAQAVPGRVSVH